MRSSWGCNAILVFGSLNLSLTESLRYKLISSYMMGTYRGPDTPDHSEQSDNEENADVANGTKGLGEGPTNSANGYDSDVIYDLDTEPDD